MLLQWSLIVILSIQQGSSGEDFVNLEEIISDRLLVAYQVYAKTDDTQEVAQSVRALVEALGLNSFQCSSQDTHQWHLPPDADLSAFDHLALRPGLNPSTLNGIWREISKPAHPCGVKKYPSPNSKERGPMDLCELNPELPQCSAEDGSEPDSFGSSGPGSSGQPSKLRKPKICQEDTTDPTCQQDSSSRLKPSHLEPSSLEPSDSGSSRPKLSKRPRKPKICQVDPTSPACLTEHRSDSFSSPQGPSGRPRIPRVCRVDPTSPACIGDNASGLKRQRQNPICNFDPNLPQCRPRGGAHAKPIYPFVLPPLPAGRVRGIPKIPLGPNGLPALPTKGLPKLKKYWEGDAPPRDKDGVPITPDHPKFCKVFPKECTKREVVLKERPKYCKKHGHFPECKIGAKRGKAGFRYSYPNCGSYGYMSGCQSNDATMQLICSRFPAAPSCAPYLNQQPSYQQPSYQQPSYQQPSYQQPSYQQPSYGYPSQQQQSYYQYYPYYYYYYYPSGGSSGGSSAVSSLKPEQKLPLILAICTAFPHLQPCEDLKSGKYCDQFPDLPYCNGEEGTTDGDSTGDGTGDGTGGDDGGTTAAGEDGTGGDDAGGTTAAGGGASEGGDAASEGGEGGDASTTAKAEGGDAAAETTTAKPEARKRKIIQKTTPSKVFPDTSEASIPSFALEPEDLQDSISGPSKSPSSLESSGSGEMPGIRDGPGDEDKLKPDLSHPGKSLETLEPSQEIGPGSKPENVPQPLPSSELYKPEIFPMHTPNYDSSTSGIPGGVPEMPGILGGTPGIPPKVGKRKKPKTFTQTSIYPPGAELFLPSFPGGDLDLEPSGQPKKPKRPQMGSDYPEHQEPQDGTLGGTVGQPGQPEQPLGQAGQPGQVGQPDYGMSGVSGQPGGAYPDYSGFHGKPFGTDIGPSGQPGQPGQFGQPDYGMSGVEPSGQPSGAPRKKPKRPGMDYPDYGLGQPGQPGQFGQPDYGMSGVSGQPGGMQEAYPDYSGFHSKPKKSKRPKPFGTEPSGQPGQPEVGGVPEIINEQISGELPPPTQINFNNNVQKPSGTVPESGNVPEVDQGKRQEPEPSGINLDGQPPKRKKRPKSKRPKFPFIPGQPGQPDYGMVPVGQPDYGMVPVGQPDYGMSVVSGQPGGMAYSDYSGFHGKPKKTKRPYPGIGPSGQPGQLDYGISGLGPSGQPSGIPGGKKPGMDYPDYGLGQPGQPGQSGQPGQFGQPDYEGVSGQPGGMAYPDLSGFHGKPKKSKRPKPFGIGPSGRPKPGQPGQAGQPDYPQYGDGTSMGPGKKPDQSGFGVGPDYGLGSLEGATPGIQPSGQPGQVGSSGEPIDQSKRQKPGPGGAPPKRHKRPKSKKPKFPFLPGQPGQEQPGQGQPDYGMSSLGPSGAPGKKSKRPGMEYPDYGLGQPGQPGQFGQPDYGMSSVSGQPGGAYPDYSGFHGKPKKSKRPKPFGIGPKPGQPGQAGQPDYPQYGDGTSLGPSGKKPDQSGYGVGPDYGLGSLEGATPGIQPSGSPDYGLPGLGSTQINFNNNVQPSGTVPEVDQGKRQEPEPDGTSGMSPTDGQPPKRQKRPKSKRPKFPFLPQGGMDYYGPNGQPGQPDYGINLGQPGAIPYPDYSLLHGKPKKSKRPKGGFGPSGRPKQPRQPGQVGQPDYPYGDGIGPSGKKPGQSGFGLSPDYGLGSLEGATPVIQPSGSPGQPDYGISGVGSSGQPSGIPGKKPKRPGMMYPDYGLGTGPGMGGKQPGLDYPLGLGSGKPSGKPKKSKRPKFPMDYIDYLPGKSKKRPGKPGVDYGMMLGQPGHLGGIPGYDYIGGPEMLGPDYDGHGQPGHGQPGKGKRGKKKPQGFSMGEPSGPGSPKGTGSPDYIDSGEMTGSLKKPRGKKPKKGSKRTKPKPEMPSIENLQGEPEPIGQPAGTIGRPGQPGQPDYGISGMGPSGQPSGKPGMEQPGGEGYGPSGEIILPSGAPSGQPSGTPKRPKGKRTKRPKGGYLPTGGAYPDYGYGPSGTYGKPYGSPGEMYPAYGPGFMEPGYRPKKKGKRPSGSQGIPLGSSSEGSPLGGASGTGSPPDGSDRNIGSPDIENIQEVGPSTWPGMQPIGLVPEHPGQDMSGPTGGQPGAGYGPTEGAHGPGSGPEGYGPDYGGYLPGYGPSGKPKKHGRHPPDYTYLDYGPGYFGAPGAPGGRPKKHKKRPKPSGIPLGSGEGPTAGGAPTGMVPSGPGGVGPNGEPLGSGPSGQPGMGQSGEGPQGLPGMSQGSPMYSPSGELLPGQSGKIPQGLPGMPPKIYGKSKKKHRKPKRPSYGEGPTGMYPQGLPQTIGSEETPLVGSAPTGMAPGSGEALPGSVPLGGDREQPSGQPSGLSQNQDIGATDNAPSKSRPSGPFGGYGPGYGPGFGPDYGGYLPEYGGYPKKHGKRPPGYSYLDYGPGYFGAPGAPSGRPKKHKKLPKPSGSPQGLPIGSGEIPLGGSAPTGMVPSGPLGPIGSQETPIGGTAPTGMAPFGTGEYPEYGGYKPGLDYGPGYFGGPGAPGGRPKKHKKRPKPSGIPLGLPFGSGETPGESAPTGMAPGSGEAHPSSGPQGGNREEPGDQQNQGRPSGLGGDKYGPSGIPQGYVPSGGYGPDYGIGPTGGSKYGPSGLSPGGYGPGYGPDYGGYLPEYGGYKPKKGRRPPYLDYGPGYFGALGAPGGRPKKHKKRPKPSGIPQGLPGSGEIPIGGSPTGMAPGSGEALPGSVPQGGDREQPSGQPDTQNQGMSPTDNVPPGSGSGKPRKKPKKPKYGGMDYLMPSGMDYPGFIPDGMYGKKPKPYPSYGPGFIPEGSPSEHPDIENIQEVAQPDITNLGQLPTDGQVPPGQGPHVEGEPSGKKKRPIGGSRTKPSKNKYPNYPQGFYEPGGMYLPGMNPDYMGMGPGYPGEEFGQAYRPGKGKGKKKHKKPYGLGSSGPGPSGIPQGLPIGSGETPLGGSPTEMAPGSGETLPGSVPLGGDREPTDNAPSKSRPSGLGPGSDKYGPGSGYGPTGGAHGPGSGPEGYGPGYGPDYGGYLPGYGPGHLDYGPGYFGALSAPGGHPKKHKKRPKPSGIPLGSGEGPTAGGAPTGMVPSGPGGVGPNGEPLGSGPSGQPGMGQSGEGPQGLPGMPQGSPMYSPSGELLPGQSGKIPQGLPGMPPKIYGKSKKKHRKPKRPSYGEGPTGMYPQGSGPGMYLPGMSGPGYGPGSGVPGYSGGPSGSPIYGPSGEIWAPSGPEKGKRNKPRPGETLGEPSGLPEGDKWNPVMPPGYGGESLIDGKPSKKHRHRPSGQPSGTLVEGEPSGKKKRPYGGSRTKPSKNKYPDYPQGSQGYYEPGGMYLPGMNPDYMGIPGYPGEEFDKAYRPGKGKGKKKHKKPYGPSGTGPYGPGGVGPNGKPIGSGPSGQPGMGQSGEGPQGLPGMPQGSPMYSPSGELIYPPGSPGSPSDGQKPDIENIQEVPQPDITNLGELGTDGQVPPEQSPEPSGTKKKRPHGGSRTKPSKNKYPDYPQGFYEPGGIYLPGMNPDYLGMGPGYPGEEFGQAYRPGKGKGKKKHKKPYGTSGPSGTGPYGPGGVGPNGEPIGSGELPQMTGKGPSGQPGMGQSGEGPQGLPGMPQGSPMYSPSAELIYPPGKGQQDGAHPDIENIQEVQEHPQPDITNLGELGTDGQVPEPSGTKKKRPHGGSRTKPSKNKYPDYPQGFYEPGGMYLPGMNPDYMGIPGYPGEEFDQAYRPGKGKRKKKHKYSPYGPSGQPYGPGLPGGSPGGIGPLGEPLGNGPSGQPGMGQSGEGPQGLPGMPQGYPVGGQGPMYSPSGELIYPPSSPGKGGMFGRPGKGKRGKKGQGHPQGLGYPSGSDMYNPMFSPSGELIYPPSGKDGKPYGMEQGPQGLPGMPQSPGKPYSDHGDAGIVNEQDVGPEPGIVNEQDVGPGAPLGAPSQGPGYGSPGMDGMYGPSGQPGSSWEVPDYDVRPGRGKKGKYQPSGMYGPSGKGPLGPSGQPGEGLELPDYYVKPGKGKKNKKGLPYIVNQYGPGFGPPGSLLGGPGSPYMFGPSGPSGKPGKYFISPPGFGPNGEVLAPAYIPGYEPIPGMGPGRGKGHGKRGKPVKHKFGPEDPSKPYTDHGDAGIVNEQDVDPGAPSGAPGSPNGFRPKKHKGGFSYPDYGPGGMPAMGYDYGDGPRKRPKKVSKGKKSSLEAPLEPTKDDGSKRQPSSKEESSAQPPGGTDNTDKEPAGIWVGPNGIGDSPDESKRGKPGESTPGYQFITPGPDGKLRIPKKGGRGWYELWYNPGDSDTDGWVQVWNNKNMKGEWKRKKK